MIRHTDRYKDNQSRYFRNDNNRRSTGYFNPDHLHQYDHLVPAANKALKFTAKATWFVLKNMVKAAWHLPGLFRKFNKPKPTERKNPSPGSAFPAP